MRLPTRQEIEYERCRRSLSVFVQTAWRYVEPGTPYEHNWHVDAICEHLEAVTSGEVLELLINMPPRMLKSTVVNVLWPCWEWAERPTIQYLTSSYDAELSVRDNVKSRDLMCTPWYKGFVAYCSPSNPWKLKWDQNVKGRYENTSRGHRIATSVGGAATGEGGNRIMCDDPISAKQALSAKAIENANTWWDRTMSTRSNDQRIAARVIVMQRLAVNDLSGHVLAKGGWTHLVLPMRWTPTIRVNGVDIQRGDYATAGVGWVDPRSAEQPLLFPARFPEAVVAKLEVDLTPVGAAGQLQQSPMAEGGNLFKRAWFTIEEVAPARSAFVALVRYWDKAGTEGAGCHTVGILMGLTREGVFWILDEVRGQWADTEREKIIKDTAKLDRAGWGRVVTWVEQEPGSSGKDVANQTIRNLAGYEVQAERPTGDKVTRARPMASQAGAGNIRVLAGKWVKPYLDEIELFPNGLRDRTDASSGAFNKLAGTGMSLLEKLRALNGNG